MAQRYSLRRSVGNGLRAVPLNASKRSNRINLGQQPTSVGRRHKERRQAQGSSRNGTESVPYRGRRGGGKHRAVHGTPQRAFPKEAWGGGEHRTVRGTA